ncbi:hypothetical protein [Mycobacterium sp. ITM-2016-00318]|nr:hypothetical protein [Mycobacterium sp. ITM-2016-00318]WNG90713.1 hypothetical protein C6A82_014235 [Mycobacterium sp. ITM-2016-00318]
MAQAGLACTSCGPTATSFVSSLIDTAALVAHLLGTFGASVSTPAAAGLR